MGIVVGQGGASRHDGPSAHANAKVHGSTYPRKQHVGGNACNQVSDVEDRNANVVLVADEPEMFLDVVKSCLGEAVPVP